MLSTFWQVWIMAIVFGSMKTLAAAGAIGPPDNAGEGDQGENRTQSTDVVNIHCLTAWSQQCPGAADTPPELQFQ